MRVKELIEELKQYPDDYIVSVVDDDDFCFDILGVAVVNDDDEPCFEILGLSVHRNEVLLIMDSPLFGVDPTEYASDPSQ